LVAAFNCKIACLQSGNAVPLIGSEEKIEEAIYPHNTKLYLYQESFLIKTLKLKKKESAQKRVY